MPKGTKKGQKKRRRKEKGREGKKREKKKNAHAIHQWIFPAHYRIFIPPPYLDGF